MIWSKMKQQLEGFISPSLSGRVEYRASGYRYRTDKAAQCYITVDKKEIFNMNDASTSIRWYKTEQEIRNDPEIQLPVSREEIEALRAGSGGNIPEERLAIIVRSRKLADYAKDMMAAQAELARTDFGSAAGKFLSLSLEECLDSNEILLNVFALIDRRLGKKRLLGMEDKIRLKHPVVQYFYEFRRSAV
jgi:hypothetical protein